MGTQYITLHLPIYVLPHIKWTLANSVHQDQMLQTAASDQGLHYLH